jgi:NADH:ubiquinone oxidoreductase subunit E
VAVMAVEVTEKLQSIVERYKSGKNSLIAVMQDISQEYGYLPEEVLQEVSRLIEVPISIFYSLATFYSSFRLEPKGRKHVCVCVGTACHVRGAAKIVESLERDLQIEAGETSRDGNFTLETVNCLGACALGPLVTVNGEYYGKMDQKKVGKLGKTLRREVEGAQETPEA